MALSIHIANQDREYLRRVAVEMVERAEGPGFIKLELTLPEYKSDKEEKEGRGPMIRSPSILISEIGHDLDEIATGWSQNEDALIEVGLHDARRDLAELWQAITEAETS